MTLKKNEGLALLDQALREVETVIKERGGTYKLVNKPQIIGDSAKDKDLEEIMKMPGEHEDGEGGSSAEEDNDEGFARQLASYADVYVNDAFGTAHRAEATTHGIAKFAPVACAGPLMAAELDALGKALRSPAHPLVAIVAGSKVSTKLTILKSLAEKVDQLIVGGGIANTFLAATGKNVGKSLCEADLIPTAQGLITKMAARLRSVRSVSSSG